MAADNAKQMINAKYNPNTMETVQDYRHNDVCEGLCDYKELPTIIPLVSYVQTLRKNDTEQNSTNHRTTPN